MSDHKLKFENYIRTSVLTEELTESELRRLSHSAQKNVLRQVKLNARREYWGRFIGYFNLALAASIAIVFLPTAWRTYQHQDTLDTITIAEVATAGDTLDSAFFSEIEQDLDGLAEL